MAKFLGPNLDARALTLTTDLALAEGGTGGHALPAAGAIVYAASASAYGVSAAGTTGQYLKTGVAGAPTWATLQASDLSDNSSLMHLAGDEAASGTKSFSSGTLNLTHGTANVINWGQVGAAAPTFTTRSAGTKLLLYPNIDGTHTDLAIGIEGATMWFGVDINTSGFKWYAGTTPIATLSGAGALTLATPLAVAQGGTGISASGTAGQVLTSGGGSAPSWQWGPKIITFTGTTGSTGLLTVTHGLGFTPTYVVVQSQNPGASFAACFGVDTLGATTFRARFMNANTGGMFASTATGTQLALCWP
jgi:hypothetical protein